MNLEVSEWQSTPDPSNNCRQTKFSLILFEWWPQLCRSRRDLPFPGLWFLCETSHIYKQICAFIMPFTKFLTGPKAFPSLREFISPQRCWGWDASFWLLFFCFRKTPHLQRLQGLWHQPDLAERQLGRGQLLVPYKMLYKLPLRADVRRSIFFLELYMVKTKTLKTLVKNDLLLSLSQHSNFGSFIFPFPNSSTYLFLLYFNC